MNPITAQTNLFLESGFRLVRETGHKIWACPCGHALVTANSSRGYGGGDTNNRLRIKRTLKACDQRLKERGAA